MPRRGRLQFGAGSEDGRAGPPQVPQHTITILLGLVFCCMNPLVPVMCLIYFLINTVTEKYNMMYVMRARFQSGGRVRRQGPVLPSYQPCWRC